MRAVALAALSLAVALPTLLPAGELGEPVVLGDPAATPSFGWSLAISGNTLAVGSNDPRRGTVWLFERRPRTPRRWRLAERLTSPLPELEAYFGRDLELDGDVLVVGVGFSDSVLVFVRNREGRRRWTFVRRVRRTGEMALDGDLLAIAGGRRVELFQRDLGGADRWGLLTRIQAANARRDWAFEVDLSGRTLGVGATRFACGSFGGLCSDGYRLFERDTADPRRWRQILHVPHEDPDAPIGFQVLVDGSTVLAEDGIRERGPGSWALVEVPAAPPTLFGRALRQSTIALPGERIEWLERRRRAAIAWRSLESVRSGCGGDLALGPRELVEGCPTGEAGTVLVYPRRPLFADRFERTDLARWSRRVGDVRRASPGLAGSRTALAVDLEGGARRSFVRAGRWGAQPSVSLDFWLLPNGAPLGGRRIDVVHLTGGGRRQAVVTLRELAGGYRVELWGGEDDGSLLFVGGASAAPDEELLWTVEWRHASGPLAADGVARLRMNGQLVAERRDLANAEATVSALTLGLPRGAAGAGHGSLLFDGVVLQR